MGDFSLSIGPLDPRQPLGTEFPDVSFSIGGIALARDKYTLTFTEVPVPPQHIIRPVIPSHLENSEESAFSMDDVSPILHGDNYDELHGTSLIRDILSGNYRSESVVEDLSERSTRIIPLIELDDDESDDDNMTVISEIVPTGKYNKRSVSVAEKLPAKRTMTRTKRIPTKKIVAALNDTDDSDEDFVRRESGIVSGNDRSEDEELDESRVAEDVYFVEKLLFLCYQFVQEVGENNRKRLRLQPKFFVKWWKWADEFNSWVTEEDMGSDGELIVAIKKNMSRAIDDLNSMEDLRNHMSGSTGSSADITDFAVWSIEVDEEDKYSLALT